MILYGYLQVVLRTSYKLKEALVLTVVLLLQCLFLCVVQFDVPALDVSEGDSIVTLEIKKTEKIDFDFDVIIIPVPLTAGEPQLICMYLELCMSEHGTPSQLHTRA